MPARCPIVCDGGDCLGGQLQSWFGQNIAHQEELLVNAWTTLYTHSQQDAACVLIVLDGTLPLLEWTRTLARALLPQAQVVRGSWCGDIQKIDVCYGHAYFQPSGVSETMALGAAAEFRRRAWTFCNVPHEPAKQPKHSVLLRRANDDKNLSPATEELLQQLSVRGGGRSYEVRNTGDADMCAQLRLWTGAKMIVSPHGQQWANSIFAAPGTTLIEVMPSSYFDGYSMYQNLTHFGGKRHKLLLSNSSSRVAMEVDETSWLRALHHASAHETAKQC